MKGNSSRFRDRKTERMERRTCSCNPITRGIICCLRLPRLPVSVCPQSTSVPRRHASQPSVPILRTFRQKHSLGSDHGLHSHSSNDLCFVSDLSGSSHSISPVALWKFIWPLLKAAVNKVLVWVPEKLDRVPDLTVTSCVTLGKSGSFTFELLPRSVSTQW